MSEIVCSLHLHDVCHFPIVIANFGFTGSVAETRSGSVFHGLCHDSFIPLAYNTAGHLMYVQLSYGLTVSNLYR